MSRIASIDGMHRRRGWRHRVTLVRFRMSTSDIPLAHDIVRLDDGFSMDIFTERPATAPAKGTVLLLSPIFGVDAIFVRTVHRWATAGFLAVAPDYFARVFPGTIPHTDDGFREAIRRVKAVDRDQMLADVREIGVHYAKNRPLFIGGYCAGGEPTMKLALDGFGDGFVIFHAARLGIYADRLASISAPLDIHFGEADPLVPLEEVKRVRAGAAGNPNIHITVHPGAVHGFTQDGSRNFHSEAAATSFAAARVLLDSMFPA
jgi:carboxymethylenebutenolidase